MLLPLTACSANYQYFAPTDSCYRVVDSRKKFYDAEDYCNEDGGNLASIHSREEMDFVAELIEASG